MMTRYGMLIDTTKCVGCYACRTACQRQNNLDPDEDFIRYERAETGTYPRVRVETVPLQCMHCDDAPCASVCPTGAAHVGADGIVAVDQGRCIGCLYCMSACPYQVRVRNAKTGAVDKCRFCVVHTEKGGASCTCVDACPTHARVFGDLDDPDSAVSRAIVEKGAKPIAGDLTRAKVYYVR